MLFLAIFSLPNVGKRSFRCFSVFPTLGNAVFAVFWSSQCWETRFSLFFSLPNVGKRSFCGFLTFHPGGNVVFAVFSFPPPEGNAVFAVFDQSKLSVLSVRFSHLKFYDWANEKILNNGHGKSQLPIIPVCTGNTIIYTFRARPIPLSIA